MAWPIFALCLSAQVELSAQRTPPSPHEEDAPAVVLEDVEVSARRGSARISAEREFDGAAIDNLAAYDRGGPGCLNRLAVWISGSPLVDHAAARSGWSKYTWSGVLVPRAECGRMLL